MIHRPPFHVAKSLIENSIMNSQIIIERMILVVAQDVKVVLQSSQ